MSSLETKIALRYLRSKRREVFISVLTVISVLGVAVSVAVLNVTLSIMTGFERELKAKLLDTSAHITVRSFSGELTGWEKIQSKLQALPYVRSVSPYTYSQAMLTTPQGAHGLLIRGITDSDSQKEKLAKSLPANVPIESIFLPVRVTVERPDGSVDEVELPPLLIGRSLQRRLMLPVGEGVTILSPQMASSPQGLIPKMRRFGVVGSYSTGLVEYENGLAYTSLKSAQQFFGLGDGVTGLEVMIDRIDDAPLRARELEGLLAGPYEIQDWTVPNKPLWDALRLEKRVYFIVLLLLILVASFSIVSTLVMVVMEKTKDIAVMKSMGLSDRRVLRIFLTQGSLIGVFGTIAGTLLGFVGCLALREYGFGLDEAVFSLSEVPVQMDWENFGVVAIAAIIITALAGIYPARRAAKLKPAEALRYE